MPCFDCEIEIDPHVNAGVPEVSVESAAIAVAVHQLVQIAQIAAEFFGSDGGVFPTLPAWRLTGHVGSGSQSRLAHFPDLLGLPLVGEQAHVWRICALAKRLHEFACLSFGFGSRGRAELSEQPATAWRQQSESFRTQPPCAG